MNKFILKLLSPNKISNFNLSNNLLLKYKNNTCKIQKKIIIVLLNLIIVQ